MAEDVGTLPIRPLGTEAARGSLTGTELQQSEITLPLASTSGHVDVVITLPPASPDHLGRSMGTFNSQSDPLAQSRGLLGLSTNSLATATPPVRAVCIGTPPLSARGSPKLRRANSPVCSRGTSSRPTSPFDLAGARACVGSFSSGLDDSLWTRTMDRSLREDSDNDQDPKSLRERFRRALARREQQMALIATAALDSLKGVREKKEEEEEEKAHEHLTEVERLVLQNKTLMEENQALQAKLTWLNSDWEERDAAAAAKDEELEELRQRVKDAENTEFLAQEVEEQLDQLRREQSTLAEGAASLRAREEELGTIIEEKAMATSKEEKERIQRRHLAMMALQKGVHRKKLQELEEKQAKELNDIAAELDAARVEFDAALGANEDLALEADAQRTACHQLKRQLEELRHELEREQAQRAREQRDNEKSITALNASNAALNALLDASAVAKEAALGESLALSTRLQDTEAALALRTAEYENAVAELAAATAAADKRLAKVSDARDSEDAAHQKTRAELIAARAELAALMTRAEEEAQEAEVRLAEVAAEAEVKGVGLAAAVRRAEDAEAQQRHASGVHQQEVARATQLLAAKSQELLNTEAALDAVKRDLRMAEVEVAAKRVERHPPVPVPSPVRTPPLPAIGILDEERAALEAEASRLQREVVDARRRAQTADVEHERAAGKWRQTLAAAREHAARNATRVESLEQQLEAAAAAHGAALHDKELEITRLAAEVHEAKGAAVEDAALARAALADMARRHTERERSAQAEVEESHAMRLEAAVEHGNATGVLERELTKAQYTEQAARSDLAALQEQHRVMQEASERRLRSIEDRNAAEHHEALTAAEARGEARGRSAFRIEVSLLQMQLHESDVRRCIIDGAYDTAAVLWASAGATDTSSTPAPPGPAAAPPAELASLRSSLQMARLETMSAQASIDEERARAAALRRERDEVRADVEVCIQKAREAASEAAAKAAASGLALAAAQAAADEHRGSASELRAALAAAEIREEATARDLRRTQLALEDMRRKMERATQEAAVHRCREEGRAAELNALAACWMASRTLPPPQDDIAAARRRFESAVATAVAPRAPLLVASSSPEPALAEALAELCVDLEKVAGAAAQVEADSSPDPSPTRQELQNGLHAAVSARDALQDEAARLRSEKNELVASLTAAEQQRATERDTSARLASEVTALQSDLQEAREARRRGCDEAATLREAAAAANARCLQREREADIAEERARSFAVALAETRRDVAAAAVLVHQGNAEHSASHASEVKMLELGQQAAQHRAEQAQVDLLTAKAKLAEIEAHHVGVAAKAAENTERWKETAEGLQAELREVRNRHAVLEAETVRWQAERRGARDARDAQETLALSAQKTAYDAPAPQTRFPAMDAADALLHQADAHRAAFLALRGAELGLFSAHLRTLHRRLVSPQDGRVLPASVLCREVADSDRPSLELPEAAPYSPIPEPSPHLAALVKTLGEENQDLREMLRRGDKRKAEVIVRDTPGSCVQDRGESPVRRFPAPRVEPWSPPRLASGVSDAGSPLQLHGTEEMSSQVTTTQPSPAGSPSSLSRRSSATSLSTPLRGRPLPEKKVSISTLMTFVPPSVTSEGTSASGSGLGRVLGQSSSSRASDIGSSPSQKTSSWIGSVEKQPTSSVHSGSAREGSYDPTLPLNLSDRAVSVDRMDSAGERDAPAYEQSTVSVRSGTHERIRDSQAPAKTSSTLRMDSPREPLPTPISMAFDGDGCAAAASLAPPALKRGGTWSQTTERNPSMHSQRSSDTVAASTEHPVHERRFSLRSGSKASIPPLSREVSVRSAYDDRTKGSSFSSAVGNRDFAFAAGESPPPSVSRGSHLEASVHSAIEGGAAVMPNMSLFSMHSPTREPYCTPTSPDLNVGDQHGSGAGSADQFAAASTTCTRRGVGGVSNGPSGGEPSFGSVLSGGAPSRGSQAVSSNAWEDPDRQPSFLRGTRVASPLQQAEGGSTFSSTFARKDTAQGHSRGDASSGQSCGPSPSNGEYGSSLVTSSKRGSVRFKEPAMVTTFSGSATSLGDDMPTQAPDMQTPDFFSWTDDASADFFTDQPPG
eukprot:TRINITY_DN5543_c0_g1_i1.p1 TRINITY_DN5543_c0_g1~~TRINITY_DN5543_c0_g1_i1.p1  ORF type:complete len:2082 (+),score=396.62 TRINITY_DN5543_c0_g1_i1:130-6375(+)